MAQNVVQLHVNLGIMYILLSLVGYFINAYVAAAAKSLQLCPTLCDPIDGSPPGSPVPGILQARTLEWVAISSSNVWKWKAKVKSLSCVQPSATPWAAAFQAPLSMGFSRQEYWSGVPLPSPVISQWPEYAYNFFLKVNFLRANQLESCSREIYQGNTELQTANWPQAQQLDWFLNLA